MLGEEGCLPHVALGAEGCLPHDALGEEVVHCLLALDGLDVLVSLEEELVDLDEELVDLVQELVDAHVRRKSFLELRREVLLGVVDLVGFDCL